MTRDLSNLQADSMRGAGSYRDTEPKHKTVCPNSNNPYGHSMACPCRVRASQAVPYWPDLEQEIDAFRDREQERRDAEIDRQQGYRN